jgi:predicted Zn-dependent protease
MSLAQREIEGLVQAALRAATLKEVSVRATASVTGNLRFAENAPTTSGEVERLEVSVTATRERASATVSGNARDAAGLRELVRRAEDLAALAPVDPEHVPPLGPQAYARPAAVDTAAAKLDQISRTDAVAAALKVARDTRLIASGLMQHAHRTTALGNTAGLRAFFADTEVSLATTMRTPDGTGSGWAGATSHRAADLDAAGLARRAAEKCERSRGGGPAIEPGPTTVVLEPQAVADLLGFLVGQLNARAADEGRSFFARPEGRSAIGEPLFHPSVHLHSDPMEPGHPSSPIAGDGLPLRRTVWVAAGKLQALARSRFWAQKTGAEPLPSPRSLFMAGGTAEVEELIRGVSRGVLVTRLWYNRMLDPRQILVTGLTRDGTFRIEDGKLAGPIKNMRYNESPVTMLSKVLALGKPRRILDDGPQVYVVPPVVVEGFRFASVSDAV